MLAWTAHAQAGRFEIQREVGYVAGIATYVLAGELALNEVLVGTLPKPSYPHPLRHSAPPLWYRLGAGALDIVRDADLDAAAHRLEQLLALPPWR